MDILLGIAFSLLAGLLPTAVYVWFVWWLDRHEKEPWWMLVAVFLWGFIAAPILSIIVSLILDVPISFLGDGLAYELVGASIVAPVVEETAKALGVFFIFLFFRREIDSILDGIIYGAMAGLGFAFIENVFYFIGALEEGGWGDWAFLVFLRAVLFGLNHAFFTGITGAGIAFMRLGRRRSMRYFAPIVGLTLAIFFHSIHNFGATLASLNCLSILLSFSSDYAGLMMIGLAILLIWRQERRWIADYLAPEIGTLLTQAQFDLVDSPWKRFGLRMRLLFSGKAGRLQRRLWGQLAQTGTELAFKKYQLGRFSQDQRLETQIEKLRRQLADIRSELSKFET